LAQPEIICLPNGPFAENCYIVADRGSADAVLVDPGDEAPLFLDRLADEGLTLRGVWLTHGHLDHVTGVGPVVERTGVPVWLHPADRHLYDAVPIQAATLLGMSVPAPPPPDHDLAAGDLMRVGKCTFEVRHVPGHSPGSVTFVGHGVALSGDVLFAGSVGRTDLPGGNAATLLRSIREELLTLPDDITIHAGHGPSTTVGAERTSNPFVTGLYRLV